MPTLGEIRRAREAGRKLKELGSRPVANIGTAFGQGKEPEQHRRNSGIRHAVKPAFQEFALPETGESRRRRVELMERLERLEWKFDRTPTLELVQAMRAMRSQISEIEQTIVVQTEVGRSRQAIEALQGLINPRNDGGQEGEQ